MPAFEMCQAIGRNCPQRTSAAARLYPDSSVRAIERGIVSAGCDPKTSDHRYPEPGLVRLTIPRRVYNPGPQGRHCGSGYGGLRGSAQRQRAEENLRGQAGIPALLPGTLRAAARLPAPRTSPARHTKNSLRLAQPQAVSSLHNRDSRSRLTGDRRYRRWLSRSVSRILYPASANLRPQGDDHLSSPGVAAGVKRPTRRSSETGHLSRLFGLAPGGVCLATAVTSSAGVLLPHRFTLAHADRRGQSASLLHFAVRSPCLAVSQHRALWSADFPRYGRAIPRSSDRLSHRQ